jgi:hypothetical protein
MSDVANRSSKLRTKVMQSGNLQRLKLLGATMANGRLINLRIHSQASLTESQLIDQTQQCISWAYASFISSSSTHVLTLVAAGSAMS